jgi:GH25 family lysozyme M1 (1,4-beta-N-acetylmuramidase)
VSVGPVIPDLYALDLGGKPDIAALVKAGAPWAGLGLKATQGLGYPIGKARQEWFKTYWPLSRSLAGTRYGVDWFRYAYHYLDVNSDGAIQADFFLALVEAAGGWGPGDLWPVVDVETSGNPPAGPASKVIDTTTKFADRIFAKLGKRPVLYAGSYLRDLGITSHMGCQYLITACYGATLPSRLYTSMGWPLDKLLGWQYCSTEAFTGPVNYPRVCPLGRTAVDLTAITICDGSTPEQQLAWLRANIGK